MYRETYCMDMYDYFGGARSKGFATLRNVSKLHPEVPKLLLN